MRVECAVTAISWIPSEAIEAMPTLPFELGIRRYDERPPDCLEEGDVERLHGEGRFRVANHLNAWIEVEGDRIVDYAQEGTGLVGSTTFRLGFEVVVPGVGFEILRPKPDVLGNCVRFVQTAGGRAGFPAPRRVRGKPYFRIHSASAWTTLALTIGVNGASFHEVVGASPFPRHWIYDEDGNLVRKSGTVDFETWYREAHGDNTPWGDEESDAFVTAAESAMERELSRDLLTTGIQFERRRLEEGDPLVEQGEPGDELYLLLDGVLAVIVDGDEVAEIGPGAIVGERASLEGGGRRTATLSARTRCRVAVVPAQLVDRQELEDLAATRSD